MEAGRDLHHRYYITPQGRHFTSELIFVTNGSALLYLSLIVKLILQFLGLGLAQLVSNLAMAMDINL